MKITLWGGAFPERNIGISPLQNVKGGIALATRTEMCRSGAVSFNCLSISGSMKEAIVMLDTILTGVVSSRCFILLSKFLQAVKIPRDSSRRETPQGVRTAPFGRRSKRAVPACFSSSATAWETADCVIYSFLAAPVKIGRAHV